MSMMPYRSGDKLHFAFICDKGNIISMGMNSSKTHTLAYKHGYTYPNLHAELDAIVKARRYDLSRCVMYNIRLSRMSLRKQHPVLRMSKPCVHCNDLVRSFGLRGVFYTTDNGIERLY